MKKLFLTILIATVALSSVAQNANRPGYEAKSTLYKFKEDKVGIPMKGYYVLKNGIEVEAIIAYNKPEFFVGDFAAGASLYICKTLSDKPVGLFDPDDPNHKEYILKDDIKAFFIDDHLYANIPSVGWRIVLNEGAIHSFIKVIKVENKGKIRYIDFKRKQWFQDEPFGSALGPISVKNHVAMLEKIPPTASATSVSEFNKIVTDYKANLISLNEAEIRYNLCFDKNSEMLIDYILGKDGLTKKEENLFAIEQDKVRKAEEAKRKEEEAKRKSEENLRLQSEAGQRASYTAKQDYFKGRSTTVSPTVASAKPEIKGKKESFYARINRIKTDGNKVGVLVKCSNLEVNPSTHTFFSNQKKVITKGTFPPLKGIETIAIETVEKLNKEFNTDVFEVVNIADIPYKENNIGNKIDDWWATKYKVIIIYNYNPYYVAYNQNSNDPTVTKKEFKAQMYVKSSVFMMAAEEGQKKMKSAGTPPKVAAYTSEPYISEETDKIFIIQELKTIINPASDKEIVNQLKTAQNEYLAKFIKKQLKKK